MAVKALTTILSGDAGNDDVVWVDDRYSNRFLRFQFAPVIEIIDVLTALEEAALLDAATVNRCLASLRDANVRFLPLRPKELLQYLSDAPVEHKAIVETPDLRSIRRYLSACALSASTLQQPAAIGSGPLATDIGEGAFIMDNARAIGLALIGLWQYETIDDETRRRRADWLITELHVDHHALMGTARIGRRDISDSYRAAGSLASFISHGIGLQPEARRKYFAWLNERVLEPRFAADANLLTTTAIIVTKTLLPLMDGG